MKRILLLLLIAAPIFCAKADKKINWGAATTATASSGDFLPTFISADRAGLLIEPYTLQQSAKIWSPLDLSKRFSWGYGANAALTASSATSYMRYDVADNTERMIDRRPAWARVQELYAEIKFRGVYLFAGMKENDRSIFNNTLGSGDLTLTNNARPIPQIRAGFVDFQNIPLTNGWVQIQGDVAYGKFADNGWLSQHFNYQYSFLTTGSYYHYKRCYFRTKPSKPFSVTVGMQHAAQFGGTWHRYKEGVNTATYRDRITLKQLVKIFYQGKGNESEIPGEGVNFIGNHLGSWDVRFRYRLRNNSEITFYVQKPWEDESGVAWQTGFDGVWGLEYKAAKPWYIDGAVVEYLDFTNQGGPMLWDIRDHSAHNTLMDPNGKATGADDYYNNFMYNGWANYGQSIGSPIFKAPVYNRDGYLRYTENHLRGFHIGLQGTILPVKGLSWRMLCSYRKSNGTPLAPKMRNRDVTSWSAEASWQMPKIKGLTLSAQAAFDAGNLYRPSTGALIQVAYTGTIL